MGEFDELGRCKVFVFYFEQREHFLMGLFEDSQGTRDALFREMDLLFEKRMELGVEKRVEMGLEVMKRREIE